LEARVPSRADADCCALVARTGDFSFYEKEKSTDQSDSQNKEKHSVLTTNLIIGSSLSSTTLLFFDFSTEVNNIEEEGGRLFWLIPGVASK
jgi:hypothetical protein